MKRELEIRIPMNSVILKISSLVAIFFLASVIYLATYWGGYQIEIFQYLALNQVIISGLSPLVDGTMMILFFWIVSFMLLNKVYPYGGYQKLSDQEKNTKYRKIIRRIITIIAFILQPTFLLILFFFDKEMYYLLLASAISIYSVFITNFLIRKEVIHVDGIDVMLTPLIVFILISAFSIAKRNSLEINENKRFDYVLLGKEYSKYLGKAGDYFIFTNFSNASTHVINKDELKKIEIFSFNKTPKTSTDSVIVKLINQ
ncbi:hypothetical protein [Reichenbachiella sp. MALMAid0571]|uniref:hypothetical protein n=1 Tax=Reichenbachiella sp. MALMAid0571 TaxID=3143939 RepID=UPI0032DFB4C0